MQRRDQSSGLYRITVVGGGAGGLELVTRLGKKLGRRGRAEITLIEKSRTHIWKPLLHEIAAGSLDVGRHELDYLAQAYWRGFKYRLGEMIGLDRARREVRLAATFDEDGRIVTPEQTVGYDALVIAIGSISNEFGTPGVKEYSIMLDTPEQAERFNRRLINACMRAQTQVEPIRPGQLHVVIIGAGATGTELAAELHQTTRNLVTYGFDRIDPERDMKITLLEAAPRIVPALPERLSKATGNILEKLGVEVRTSARVVEVRADGVMLASGDFIPAELVVWAAGVKGPSVLRNLDGLETSPAGQLVVRPTLQTTRDDDVFAMGDCSYLVPEGETQPVPPRAQAAHQEASHLYKNLQRHMRGEPLRPFVYRDFGSLVSLGHYSTVGSLMGFISGRSMMVEGFIAKLVYRSLYKMHEVALYGPWSAFLVSLSRSLTRRTHPQVKLH